MSFRLLRQLARLPLRQRHFADPFFYPTELYFRPYQVPFPEFRHRDVFEEFNRMFDLLAEPEMLQPQRTKPKEISSTDKSQDVKSQDNTKTQEAKAPETKPEQVEKENQSIKPVEEKPRYRDEWSLFSLSSEEPTFGRAQKIFERASKEEKPELTLDENDELLKGTDEFKDVLKYFENQGMNFTGSTYQSSTIIKDGKVVTVSKHSRLGDDGTVKTEVMQEFRDSKGQKVSRKWVKEDKIKEQIENKVESKEETKEQITSENAQKA